MPCSSRPLGVSSMFSVTLTGDYVISDTDAAAFGVALSRTSSSLDPQLGARQAGQSALFGPQWAVGGESAADTDYTSLRQPTTATAELALSDGTLVQFTKTTRGWTAEPGAEHLALTGPDTAGRWTLREDDGTVTTFAKPTSSATVATVETTSPPGPANTTRYVYETDPAATSKVRLKRILAPTSAIADLATCNTATPPVGCRVLELVYATSTTATTSALGDYTGRVSSVRLWAATPRSGSTAAAMTATTIAAYAYDGAGDLRETWDPQISPALKTGYGYTSGRITTVTEPGQKPWTLGYDSTGRLTSASRATLTPGTDATENGTATTTVVYDVPVTGAGAPYDLSPSAVAQWGQTDQPTTAIGVVPPSPTTGAASTDLTRAEIHYLNVTGREVNTASPGGHLDVTEYDNLGNTLRELTASNRALALGATPDSVAELAEFGLETASVADRAEQLSTRNSYSSDGQRLLETLGPLHTIRLETTQPATDSAPALSAGAEVAARQHTRIGYDEGRPADATAENLPTRVDVGAQIDGRENAPDADIRTTTTSYDWTLGLPTRTVNDPGDGNLAISRTTSYDNQGRVTETRMPKAVSGTGGDAGTTRTSYYTGTAGTGPCDNRPEWADLVCQTTPGGPITGGGSNPTELPSATTTYTRTGKVSTVTETANGVTRTATTTYDTADRLTTATVSGGVGTAVAPVHVVYDPVSGQAIERAASTPPAWSPPELCGTTTRSAGCAPTPTPTPAPPPPSTTRSTGRPRSPTAPAPPPVTPTTPTQPPAATPAA